MARLFITPREMNFISDITKEVIKDVIGQKLYLYPISELKTKSHDVYNESTQKIFDNPIIIDALVSSNFQQETRTTEFSIDAQYKIEAFIQYRDLVDKGINLNIGDFFSYGENFYEITERMQMKTIYGQAEHKDGIKIIGTKTRESHFHPKLRGPTDISNTDVDAVQTTFVQQRGFTENSEGPTNDVRELIKNNVVDEPLTGPKEISDKGASDGSTNKTSFYGDE